MSKIKLWKFDDNSYAVEVLLSAEFLWVIEIYNDRNIENKNFENCLTIFGQKIGQNWGFHDEGIQKMSSMVREVRFYNNKDEAMQTYKEGEKELTKINKFLLSHNLKNKVILRNSAYNDLDEYYRY